MPSEPDALPPLAGIAPAGAMSEPRAVIALVIPGRLGLHARQAARVVEIARRYASTVTLVHAEVRASAKELLDVLYLAAPSGALLEVSAIGHDAEAAVDALATYLSSLGNDA